MHELTKKLLAIGHKRIPIVPSITRLPSQINCKLKKNAGWTILKMLDTGRISRRFKKNTSFAQNLVKFELEI